MIFSLMAFLLPPPAPATVDKGAAAWADHPAVGGGDCCCCRGSSSGGGGGAR